MAKTEMILAKMERRREMTRSACTASSQGGKSHSLRKTNFLGPNVLGESPYQSIFVTPDLMAASEEMIKLESREAEP